MTSPAESLRKVRTFPQLVDYLRDELSWPVEEEKFDALMFEWDATELGIDPKNAAKIVEIKQLRPLTSDQPWGIFFIKFAPKPLPIVVLRRILGQLVVHKRASASKASQRTWAARDLLFISAHGEGGQPELTFAHFSDPPSDTDLPTLRVLGWDEKNTNRKLGHVAGVLHDRLSWPVHPRDGLAWREKWASAFALRPREVIRTSRELSIRLADLARVIRDRIRETIEIETEKGQITRLMKAFQVALIHDLDADSFADMYAQTIAYGLLSARIADPTKKTADDLAGHMRTNPFLRELMETFLKVGGRRGKIGGPNIDFDELGVSEVVDLLDDPNTHMEDIVRDFDDRNPQEDPVIHFYEGFAKAYDPIDKVRRGEFYTPRPVVSYMVRAVDGLLRSDFGLEDGLGDTTTWGEMAKRHEGLKLPEGVLASQPFVQILDPATGTGTFLVEIIDLIHKTFVSKWRAQGHSESKIATLWNEYVPEHLLPRLHAYELKMAPYAIAHLKVGLKLLETGYRFDTDTRARIYLTNALEPVEDFSDQLAIAIPALAREAQEVNAVKATRRFTVIVGNPPYSDASQNLGPQFRVLVDRFRFFQGARIRERGAIRFEHAINNDYVKFWGMSLLSLSRVSAGVVCFITSSSFLEGKSFRGLREGMLEACDQILVTDLHGEGWAGPLARAGIVDENLFDIQTGVSVTRLGKRPVTGGKAMVTWGDLTGTYSEKAAVLLNEHDPVLRLPIELDARHYLPFIPRRTEGCDEYWTFPQVDSFFLSSVDGIKTSRDGLVMANSREECKQKILRFAEPGMSIPQIEESFRFKAGSFDVREAQRHIRNTFNEDKIVPIWYRPLDVRFIYYDRELILSHRMNLMPCMLSSGSRALVFASRLASRGFDHVVAADTLCSNKYASHDINSRMFPLVGLFEGILGASELRSNVHTDILDKAGFGRGVNPVERAALFGGYIYAVTNAPSYRDRYLQEISQDFPRVPLPKDEQLGAALSALGEELQCAHRLALSCPKEEFVFAGVIDETLRSPEQEDGDLRIGESSRLQRVPYDVWNFRMAGYHVCKSWFSAGGKVGLQREGSPITQAVVNQLRRILWSIKTTIKVRQSIDEAIAEKGGWPAAFKQAAVSLGPADRAMDSAPKLAVASLYDSLVPPVRKVAERRILPGGGDDSSDNTEDDLAIPSLTDEGTADREDLMCPLRGLFTSGSERFRDQAIVDLVKSFGFQRVGSRVRQMADDAIRTAVRRGIIENRQGRLRICVRSMNGYERSFLKEQFLASLTGRRWTERVDATRLFARWMGFRRTGTAIEDTSRSLISGLLREGKLESKGTSIRRVSA